MLRTKDFPSVMSFYPPNNQTGEGLNCLPHFKSVCQILVLMLSTMPDLLTSPKIIVTDILATLFPRLFLQWVRPCPRPPSS